MKDNFSQYWGTVFIFFNYSAYKPNCSCRCTGVLYIVVAFTPYVSILSKWKIMTVLKHINVYRIYFPIKFTLTGPNPWGMAICLVWKSVLLGIGWNWSLFFVRGRTVESGGGGAGWLFFKINILAITHLKINILAWVPRKINK